MQINLISKNVQILNLWNDLFHSYDNVKIYNNTIFSIKSDAICAPGNSFGIMDGGLDLSISMKYGYEFQKDILKKIQNDYYGEISVGNAFLVKTFDGNSVIYSPTMRVPMILPKKSLNAYFAFRAALICARQSSIKSINIPAFCTGVGQMDAKKCVFQMHEAYKNIILDGYKNNFTNWMDAQKSHNELLQVKNKDIQYK